MLLKQIFSLYQTRQLPVSLPSSLLNSTISAIRGFWSRKQWQNRRMFSLVSSRICSTSLEACSSRSVTASNHLLVVSLITPAFFSSCIRMSPFVNLVNCFTHKARPYFFKANPSSAKNINTNNDFDDTSSNPPTFNI